MTTLLQMESESEFRDILEGMKVEVMIVLCKLEVELVLIGSSFIVEVMDLALKALNPKLQETLKVMAAPGTMGANNIAVKATGTLTTSQPLFAALVSDKCPRALGQFENK